MKRRSLLLAPTLAAVFFLLPAPDPARADAPFVNETIQSAGFVGTDLSMALDADGNPHVVYWDISNQFLVYATKRDDGSWMSEVVSASGSWVRRPPLLSTPRGGPTSPSMTSVEPTTS